MLCDQEMEPPSLYGNDPCATVTVATIRNLGPCKSYIIFGLGGFGLKRVDADKAARTDCAAAYLQVIEHLSGLPGSLLLNCRPRHLHHLGVPKAAMKDVYLCNRRKIYTLLSILLWRTSNGSTRVGAVRCRVIRE